MRRLIAIASLFVVVMGVPVMAQDVNFEADTVGSPPKGWMLTMTGKGAPKWTVERKASSRS